MFDALKDRQARGSWMEALSLQRWIRLGAPAGAGRCVVSSSPSAEDEEVLAT